MGLINFPPNEVYISQGTIRYGKQPEVRVMRLDTLNYDHEYIDANEK